MKLRNAILVSAAVAAASPALAGFTPIQTSGEPNLNAIFASNYGALSGGDMNSSGFTTALGYTFTRVHDFGFGGPTNLHNAYAGSTSDARLQDGTAAVTFLVKYAGNTNRLGWTNQVGSPTGYTDVIGSSGSSSTTMSSNFQLVMNVNGTGSTYWGSDQLAGGGTLRRPSSARRIPRPRSCCTSASRAEPSESSTVLSFFSPGSVSR